MEAGCLRARLQLRLCWQGADAGVCHGAARAQVGGLCSHIDLHLQGLISKKRKALLWLCKRCRCTNDNAIRRVFALYFCGSCESVRVSQPPKTVNLFVSLSCANSPPAIATQTKDRIPLPLLDAITGTTESMCRAMSQQCVPCCSKTSCPVLH